MALGLLYALNLIKKCGESKYNMFTGAPAFMELDRLQKEVDKLNENYIRERDAQNNFSSFSKYNKSFNEDLDEVGRP